MDITKLRPGKNRIVVKLNSFNDSVSFGENQRLFLETKYTPAENAQVMGTVHSLPESLYFNKKDLENSMPWETKMELEVGDTVFIEYLAVLMALGTRYDQAASYPNEMFVEQDGVIYIFILYQDVYFAMRDKSVEPSANPSKSANDKEIIPINGFCIAKGIDIGLKSKEIIIPDNQKVVWSPRWAEIVVVGKPCTNFLEDKFRDRGEFNKGDLVFFKNYANQRIEDSLHRTLFKDDPDTPYVVIQRRWMKAVLPNKYKKEVENRVIA